MKIYCGMDAFERVAIEAALARWQHLLPKFELVHSPEASDVVLFDSDQPCFYQRRANQRLVGVGSARIYGETGHIPKPIRGFQVASAILEMDAKAA